MISFGNSGYDISSSTFSFDNNGDFLIIFVSHVDDNLTDVSYGGISMTQVGTSQFMTDFNRYFSVWVLVNPPTGSNDVTRSGGGGTDIYFGCISVIGVDQSTPYSGLNTASGNGSNPTLSITTTIPNAYAFSCGLFFNSASAGANTTSIQEIVGASAFSFRSTNPVSPAGSFVLNHTMSSGGYVIKGFAINPANQPTNSNFFAII